MNKRFSRIFYTVIVLLTIIATTSCTNKKFHVEGNITEAKDSILYFENVSLNGPVALDSVKLDKDGSFDFDGDATSAPEFYRLRIAGQIINLAIDSTETVKIKASYPTMSSRYDVSGSEENIKIKELALKQMSLQSTIDAIVQSPNLGVDAVEDSVNKVLNNYKQEVKINYIYKEPMKAYSYFALFQTFRLDGAENLIFNPRTSEEDVRAFAAVATSWDTFYPKEKRGENLHNIAIEGMKDVRLLRARQNESVDASKVTTSGIIDIALQDNKGFMRKLSDMKGKVVMLDFHVFSSEGSLKRIMKLRELYDKYHAQGFEIYQVSLDGDEHFWKTQTANLPWISVRDESGNSATSYNVRSIPTFFIIDKNNVLDKRDVQIKDLDAEIKSLL